MTLPSNDGSALFLAIPMPDGAEDPDLSFDDSEEGMRRLRHPFAVAPAAVTPPAAGTGDDRERRS